MAKKCRAAKTETDGMEQKLKQIGEKNTEQLKKEKERRPKKNRRACID